MINLSVDLVFLNSNYPVFMQQVLPELIDRKCVYVGNEFANLAGHNWILKDFRIFEACFIVDQSDWLPIIILTMALLLMRKLFFWILDYWTFCNLSNLNIFS